MAPSTTWTRPSERRSRRVGIRSGARRRRGAGAQGRRDAGTRGHSGRYSWRVRLLRPCDLAPLRPFVIRQIRRQPALRRREIHPLPAGIILDLVAIDLAHAEVLRLRAPEVVAADRRAGQHREALGETDAGTLFRAEEGEQGRLLGMVWARRVAGRGADALVALLDQVLMLQR